MNVLAHARPHSRPARTLRGSWPRFASAPTLTVLLVTALSSSLAWAGDRRDHERARAAVEAGQALPLPILLERLRRTHPGQVLELELERDEGRWIYEVKLLQADGQLLKLDVDAASGQVLRIRRKDGRKAERDAARRDEPARELPKEPSKEPPKEPPK